MNKQNQNDQNKDWSKQQKGSNEGMSGNTQGQGNQDPVEERSPKASDNRQQDQQSGDNRDPEINMPSNQPEKTEKKIPKYE